MNKWNDFREMGRANAEEAIDQVASFENLEDAIANYYENMNDTLMERGVRDRAPEAYEAHEGFIAVLVKHGIEFRP